MQFMNCPDFELCKRLGRHLHGRMYEKYTTDERYKKLIDNEGPSLLQKARNFASAFTKHVISGMSDVSEFEAGMRLKICQECPFFESSQRRCLSCGCYTDFKINWATSKCPENKWPDSQKLKELEELHLMW